MKWIFRYLRGTSKVCICFGNEKPILVGYTDAGMAGDVDSRKSTSGYLITFARGAVSWQSKLQKCVALSTTEAEFIAATEACKELFWMKRFLEELGLKQERYVLYCDSQSAIHLSKNPSFHSRSKHIDVRYHWIRDVLDNKFLELEKIHTDQNGADMMTKILPKRSMKLAETQRVWWIPTHEATGELVGSASLVVPIQKRKKNYMWRWNSFERKPNINPLYIVVFGDVKNHNERDCGSTGIAAAET